MNRDGYVRFFAISSKLSSASYGVLKKTVFQNFTAEFVEFAEKILKNSAFYCVLSGEKDLRH